MLTKVTLAKIGNRVKALNLEGVPTKVLKVIPQKYQNKVSSAGFLDIRSSNKLTLTSEERVLITLHGLTTVFPHILDAYPKFADMEIIAKIQRTNRLGEVTYLAKIKDAAGVFIPYIEWKLINLPTIYENIA